MKSRIFQVWVFMFAILLTTAVGAEEIHQIPTAPADYLTKKNIFDVATEAKDSRFIKRTGRLFKRKCQKCHGEKGDGMGPAAGSFKIKPVAFAKPGYMASRKDGQLYWIIENGSPDTEMPAHGFGSRANFKAEEIWKLITFLRYKFTN